MIDIRCKRLASWLAACVLAASCIPASAAQRVALVIGNASYAHAPALANPLNDAADVGAALRRLGFEVTRLRNTSYATLRRGLQEFTRAASASEVAVVFYAGHGIEVDQSNFLVPVDARLESDQDVEFEAVPLDLVLRSMERASGLRLVILDACRDNPFAASMRRAGMTRSIGRGLARVEPLGETLVAYAAKGGTVAADGKGRNSPYTQALLRHLEEPGLEISLMFRKVRDAVVTATGRRQVPFTYGSLSSREVYLAAAPAPASSTTEQPGMAAQRELLFWESVKDSGSVEELQAYLDRYPGGTYAALARSRINRLGGGSQGSAPQNTAGPAAAPTYDQVGAAYKRGDYATALKGIRAHAEQGLAVAQKDLGHMYQNGLGVTRDDAEAVRWYRKGAAQGLAAAQNNLGHMYQNGLGVTRDDAEAVRWFRKGAAQGLAAAQNNLGHMYQNGLGVTRDDAEAVRWFRKGAAQGLAAAQNNLGHMYQNGLGVTRDDAEAVRWFRKGAAQGLAVAQSYLGHMYQNGLGVTRDDAEAVRWFRKGAAQGLAVAQSYLGHMYQNGLGVTRDDAEAVRWYRKGAAQGLAVAQNNLGYMYQNGLGVTRDDAEAVRWYRLAAKQGLTEAKTALRYLEQ